MPTATPWPAPVSATAIAPPDGVPSGATTTVGPSARQASTTSASIACASASRASRCSRPSRLLPSTPRKGTTTVGIAADPTAAHPAQAAVEPGPRAANSRSSNQCVARSASATTGSV